MVTNLAVAAIGTYVTARFAIDLGAPPSVGWAFALNPAVLLATAMDLSDALLCLLVVTFVWMVHRRRWGWAVGAAVLAALAKESSLVVIVAVAAFAPALPRRFRIGVGAGAIGAFVAWSTYSRLRLGGATDRIDNFELPPFQGIIDTARFGWIPDGRWAEAAIGLMIIALGVVIVVRWFRRRNLLMAAAGAPILVVPLYSSYAFNGYADSTRAIGASLTLFVLDLAAERAQRRSSDHHGALEASADDRPTTAPSAGRPQEHPDGLSR